MHPIRPEPTRPGQESVWDFPRPAIVEPASVHIVIRVGAVIVADTRRAMRTLETSHPPSYYIPLEDIVPGTLVPAEGSSFCEWKGHARYFDVIADRERRERAAWSYPDPTPPFAILRDHVAFYAAAMDACFVDGEQVVAQPGGFYGGWITSAVAGPFKGVPGSRFW
ncbi:DUF427 domain-containing protein [Polymorphobacter sp. PAMC 29334]|uniref:DUF427 domain-containing protein n=1 Tax=Polymorphobacter sp. PAMC 29334 TaxID=2862331 RepID=UPI001C76243D|nr:DUF427 domain-containing protein [Polymorphobacter sp. PAMC 29334]QYE36839.1 DUF427 domain-containing protein [Polymorphobacter sp. PAMC 29334]